MLGRPFPLVFSAATIGAFAAAPLGEASCDKTLTVVPGTTVIAGNQYPTITISVAEPVFWSRIPAPLPPR